MTHRIVISILASASVVLSFAAAPALSAIYPAKEQLADAGIGGKSDEIRIVPPSQEGALGTIWFATTNGPHGSAALSFGGPR